MEKMVVPFAFYGYGRWGEKAREYVRKMVDIRLKATKDQMEKDLISRNLRYGLQSISIACVKAMAAYMDIMRFGKLEKKERKRQTSENHSSQQEQEQQANSDVEDEVEVENQNQNF